MNIMEIMPSKIMRVVKCIYSYLLVDVSRCGCEVTIYIHTKYIQALVMVLVNGVGKWEWECSQDWGWGCGRQMVSNFCLLACYMKRINQGLRVKGDKWFTSSPRDLNILDDFSLSSRKKACMHPLRRNAPPKTTNHDLRNPERKQKQS